MDFWEIKIGDSLLEQIEKGLRDADFVIAVLSHESVKSEWAKKELRIALQRSLVEHKKTVLPIKIDDCEVPGILQDLVYADFRHYETGFQNLLTTLYPEGLLQKCAEETVHKAKESGHMLPAFFFKNAISAIKRRLVPLADTNYGILLWGGMEFWFENNLENRITRLQKWEQFSYLLGFASGRFSTPEAGTYSIPWRFVSDSEKQKFDWDRLSISKEGVRERALFCQGPHRRDIRLSHQAVIDFAVAVRISIQLGILRDELLQRLPKDMRFSVEQSRESELSAKLLGPSLLKMVIDLSRTSPDYVYDIIRSSTPTYRQTSPGRFRNPETDFYYYGNQYRNSGLNPIKVPNVL